MAKPHQLTTRRDDPAREGERHAEQLAKSHYENFSVGSFLLPRELRQELFNIYAFCRLADDFADETAGGVSGSTLLDEWSARLEEIGGGSRPFNVPKVSATAYDQLFSALAGTVQRRKLSLQPFRDLITAFRLDLVKTRYETWDELLEYARYSANPVGRLVLGVSGDQGDTHFALSDNICTALQLANHWQDIAEDYVRGRIYVPVEILNRFGVTESMIENREFNGQFRAMMVELADRTEELFSAGRPLLGVVPPPLKPQLYLYWGGGMAALAAVRSNDYDVLNHKSRVRNSDKLKLAAGALWRWILVKGKLL